MADNEQEILLRTLVTKFSLDESSVREVLEQTRGAKDLEKSVIVEKEREIVSELAATAEIKKGAKLAELDALARNTTDYYDRQVALARDNAEKLKEIEEHRAEDMAKIRARTEDVDGGGAGGGFFGGIASGLGRLDSAIKNILPGIGLGFIATGLSAAGTAAEIKAATDRLREYDTAGRSLASASGHGFGSGFGEAATAGIQQMHALSTGVIDEKRAASILSIFTPITSGGAGGGIQVGKLGTEAVGAGAAFGVNPEIVARTMVMLRRLDDVPIDKLGERFTELGNRAFQAGLPVVEYGDYVRTLTEQTKRYGIGLQDNMRLVDSFARELSTGIVTIQDLSRLQTSVGNVGPGNRAFAMQEMMRRGLVSGELLSKMQAAGDPAALEHLGLMISQGEEGDDLREQLMAGTAGVAKAWGEEFAPGQGAGQELLRDRFTLEMARKLGITQEGQTLAAQRALIDAAEGTRTEISKGYMKGAEGFASLEDAVKDGLKGIGMSVGEIRKFMVEFEILKDTGVRGLSNLLGGDTQDKNLRLARATIDLTVEQWEAGYLTKDEAAKAINRAGGMHPDALRLERIERTGAGGEGVDGPSFWESLFGTGDFTRKTTGPLSPAVDINLILHITKPDSVNVAVESVDPPTTPISQERGTAPSSNRPSP
jgi:hypothetical protein